MSTGMANPAKLYTYEEFFKFDFEVQKFIYMNNQVIRQRVDVDKVDNDEIFAMFLNTKTIVFLSNRFFIRSKNSGYIVYDKVTKKVRSNANRNYHLSEVFMKHFFSNSLIQRQISFPNNMSNTFIKKVIENKINTVKDTLNYVRSYVYRKKDIPDKVLLNFNCIQGTNKGLILYVPFIKNWDLFTDINNCKKLYELSIERIRCVNYQINSEEDLNVFKLQSEYEHWENKMDKKING